jgi:hypothetical protein
MSYKKPVSIVKIDALKWYIWDKSSRDREVRIEDENRAEDP